MQASLSVFCLARSVCVAVPPVEISSAIYKGRFRNCSAGPCISLHEKKKKEKGKKSGKKTGEKWLVDYEVTRGKKSLEITQRKKFSCALKTLQLQALPAAPHYKLLTCGAILTR